MIAERFGRVLKSALQPRLVDETRQRADEPVATLEAEGPLAANHFSVFPDAKKPRKTAANASITTTESAHPKPEAARFDHRRRPHGDCSWPGVEGDRLSG